MNTKRLPGRILYYDILNICACFCVVALHCNGIVHSYSEGSAWKQALVVEVACYWAVPVFLMLSGATLIEYRCKYDTKTYIRKRIDRAVFPWLVWSGISLVWKTAVSHQISMESWSLANLISMLLNSKIETKYWFFPSLFAVYMGIPFLAPFAQDKKNKKLLWYMALLAFITYSVMPVLCKAMGISWPSALGFPMASGVFLFPVLGYLLATNEISSGVRHASYVLAAASMLLRYFVTLVLSVQDGSTNKTLFGYIQFHSVFLACAVFLFFKHRDWESLLRKVKISERAIARISSCSLGIYLIHAFVMYYEKQLMDVWETGWKWRILGPFLTWAVSLCIVFCTKKIPGIRKLFP
ncbi:MAG: acyltransferase [Eubacteriales bacterium]|nr:acyltransferase [Eubacteriales bacterium]